MGEVVVDKVKEPLAGDGEKDFEKSKVLSDKNREKRCETLKEDAPPNRDPSSEALYSPSKMTTSSRNEFTVTDLDAHNPSVHSDNSTGSTTSFTVTDITPRDSSSASRNNSGEGSVTSRQRWRVSPTPTSTSTPGPSLSSFHRVLTPSIIFCTNSTSEYPSLCLLEMSTAAMHTPECTVTMDITALESARLRLNLRLIPRLIMLLTDMLLLMLMATTVWDTLVWGTDTLV